MSGQVLNNVWVPWVTHGFYVGYRRILFSTQACRLPSVSLVRRC
jgi:hypothetical protein